MEIFIDGTKVDFSLEGEKNLSEIMEGIYRYLDKYGEVVTDIKVDGKNIQPYSNFEDVNIDDVKKVELSVAPAIEVAFVTLLQIRSMLDYRVEPSTISWIGDAVRVSLGTMGLLNETNLEELTNAVKSSNVEMLKKIISREIAKFTSIVSKNLPPLVEKIKEVREEVRNLIPTAEKISEDLQIGEDVSAITGIQEFISVIERGLELFSDIKNWIPISAFGENFSEVHKNINTMFNEVVSAMENGDFVLLSDIFGYDAIEQINSYLTLLDQIYSILTRIMDLSVSLGGFGAKGENEVLNNAP